MQQDEPTLTTRDAAALLRRHEVTLRQWRRRKPPFGPTPIKRGGRWLYRESEVIDYRDNGERAAS